MKFSAHQSCFARLKAHSKKIDGRVVLSLPDHPTSSVSQELKNLSLAAQKLFAFTASAWANV